jgi:hypothetical protein
MRMSELFIIRQANQREQAGRAELRNGGTSLGTNGSDEWASGGRRKEA